MDSTPIAGVWSEIKEALATPAGKARARELIQAKLGLWALAFPSVRIVQAILPLVQAIFGALGNRSVKVDPSEPSPQTAVEDRNDWIAARQAVIELNRG